MPLELYRQYDNFSMQKKYSPLTTDKMTFKIIANYSMLLDNYYHCTFAD